MAFVITCSTIPGPFFCSFSLKKAKKQKQSAITAAVRTTTAAAAIDASGPFVHTFPFQFGSDAAADSKAPLNRRGKELENPPKKHVPIFFDLENRRYGRRLRF